MCQRPLAAGFQTHAHRLPVRASAFLATKQGHVDADLVEWVIKK